MGKVLNYKFVYRLIVVLDCGSDQAGSDRNGTKSLHQALIFLNILFTPKT